MNEPGWLSEWIFAVGLGCIGGAKLELLVLRMYRNCEYMMSAERGWKIALL